MFFSLDMIPRTMKMIKPDKKQVKKLVKAKIMQGLSIQIFKYKWWVMGIFREMTVSGKTPLKLNVKT